MLVDSCTRDMVMYYIEVPMADVHLGLIFVLYTCIEVKVPKNQQREN